MPHPLKTMAAFVKLCALLTALWLQSPVDGKLVLPSWEGHSTQDDYDVLKFQPDRPPGFSNYSQTGTVNSTGRSYIVHVAMLSKGFPSTFGFELPQSESDNQGEILSSIRGCCHPGLTSETAKLHNCMYATNAGFFDHTWCCVGNLIIDGRPIQLPASNRINFGLTGDSFIIGYLTNETLHSGHPKFMQLITGAGWLVRQGKSYVNESMVVEDIPEGFVMEKAPRTTIAVDLNGMLYLVQVDGEENIKAGLDLHEMAEVLLRMGVWQAVNLDGGGSSVSVYRGTVISKPTCLDTHFICERPVTSITCIKDF